MPQSWLRHSFLPYMAGILSFPEDRKLAGKIYRHLVLIIVKTLEGIYKACEKNNVNRL